MPGVLIIKFGALGDVLMAAPLVRRIVDHHGTQSMHVLTAPGQREFFTRWPGVAVQAFPRRGIGAMAAAAWWLRRQRFTRIYDLQSNDRSGMLCAVSGAGERVGNHPRFPYTHHPRTPWRGDIPIHARWRDVLASAGVDPGPAVPWLPVTTEERDSARNWANHHGLEAGHFAILHAGASPGHGSKRWPYFAALARELCGAGINVVWAGGADDADLNRDLARTGGVDACAAFTLTGLAALGELARFAVVNDSAPMHALACSHIPVFGLFGPTDWRRNHAMGQAAHVIAAAGDADAFRPVDLAALPVSTVLGRLRGAGLMR